MYHKGFILLAIAITTSLSIFSQNILQHSSVQNKSRIENDLAALLQKSESYRAANHMHKCDSVANLLLIHSANLDARYYEARAYLLLGYVQKDLKNEVNAFVFFNNASKIFNDIEEYQYIAESQLEMSEILATHKLWQNANSMLKNVDSLYNSVNFKFDLVRLYANIGEAAFQLNQFNDAAFYFIQYRKFAVMYQNWDAQLLADMSICKTYRAMGEYNSAIQYDLELVKWLSQLNKSEIYYSEINALGEDYFNSGNNSNASNTFQIVIDNSKDKREISKALLMLYEIAAKENKPERELVYLNKALSFSSDENEKAQIINTITNLHISNSNITKAYELNSSVLPIAQKLTFENQIAIYNLAQRIALLRKNNREAAKYLNISKQITDSVSAIEAKQKNDSELLTNSFEYYINNSIFNSSKISDSLAFDKQNLKLNELDSEILNLRNEYENGSEANKFLKKRNNIRIISRNQLIDSKSNTKNSSELFHSDSVTQPSIIIDSTSKPQIKKNDNNLNNTTAGNSKINKGKRKYIIFISIIIVLFIALIFTFWLKQRAIKNAKSNIKLKNNEN